LRSSSVVVVGANRIADFLRRSQGFSQPRPEELAVMIQAILTKGSLWTGAGPAYCREPK